MKLQIKNLKHAPSLSEETHAFTADIYIDGKKVGHAENSGQGGSTDISAYHKDDWDKIREAEAYFNNQPPIRVKCEYTDTGFYEYPCSLESVVDDTVDDLIMLRYLKLQSKKRILVLDAAGELVTYDWWKGSSREITDDIRKEFEVRGEIILNGMSDADLLEASKNPEIFYKRLIA